MTGGAAAPCAREFAGKMHNPVMVREAIDLLAPREGGVYLDGTLGGGGHARAILGRLGDRGTLIGIDLDPGALACAGRALEQWRGCTRLLHGNFAEMKTLAEEQGFRKVDGIILDLGMSSMQVDQAGRGFSFMQEGPLDMRMDSGRGKSAADLVAGLKEEELVRIICRLGEEPAGRRIARAIALERRKGGEWTTLRLARTVESVVGRRGRIHPATKTFQALRIAVNGELDNLERGLEAGIALLAEGGRMAVIAYHSLEDRIVKGVFREHAGRMASLAEGGSRWEGALPRVKNILKKPLEASAEEILLNPRSRSAKLRCIERTSDHGK